MWHQYLELSSANAMASAYNKIKFSQATIQVVKNGLKKQII